MSTSVAKFEGSAAGVVNPGDVLGGKYRVEQVIGEGGMGIVVAATHLHLDEKVAIKMLLPEAVRSPEIVGRFLREARAAVKIKSEHVARVTDVGTLESGSPYMVMEYLAGSDLADAIEKHGPISPDLAMEYVLQASEAIVEAHAAGIVHRDLKPANLFLTRRADGSPCIKVLDFGISKISDGSNHSKTKTSAVMGSPAYMSPEQMKSSRDVDGRTDIWALGAIMYELLAGAPPFDADTVPQLCIMIMQEPLPPLSRFRADVPHAVEAVIRRCQEKDPAHRFQHMGELAAALSPLVTGRARFSADRVLDIARTSGLTARSSVEVTRPAVNTAVPSHTVATGPAPSSLGTDATVASLDPVGTSGSTSAMWSRPVEPRKSSGSILAAAIIASLVVGGGVAILLFGGRSTPPPATGAEAVAPSAAVTLAAPTSNAVILPPVVTVSAEPVAVEPSPTVDAAKPPSTATKIDTTAPRATSGKAAVPPKPATPVKPPPKSNPGGGLFNDRN